MVSYFAGLFGARSAPVEAAARAPVRVVAEQRVAGYNAVVLEADSASTLADWLKAHGYAERAELSAWLPTLRDCEVNHRLQNRHLPEGRPSRRPPPSG